MGESIDCKFNGINYEDIYTGAFIHRLHVLSITSDGQDERTAITKEQFDCIIESIARGFGNLRQAFHSENGALEHPLINISDAVIEALNKIDLTVDIDLTVGNELPQDFKDKITETTREAAKGALEKQAEDGITPYKNERSGEQDKTKEKEAYAEAVRLAPWKIEYFTKYCNIANLDEILKLLEENKELRELIDKEHYTSIEITDEKLKELLSRDTYHLESLITEGYSLDEPWTDDHDFQLAKDKLLSFREDMLKILRKQGSAEFDMRVNNIIRKEYQELVGIIKSSPYGIVPDEQHHLYRKMATYQTALEKARIVQEDDVCKMLTHVQKIFKTNHPHIKTGEIATNINNALNITLAIEGIPQFKKNDYKNRNISCIVKDKEIRKVLFHINSAELNTQQSSLSDFLSKHFDFKENLRNKDVTISLKKDKTLQGVVDDFYKTLLKVPKPLDILEPHRATPVAMVVGDLEGSNKDDVPMAEKVKPLEAQKADATRRRKPFSFMRTRGAPKARVNEDGTPVAPLTAAPTSPPLPAAPAAPLLPPAPTHPISPPSYLTRDARSSNSSEERVPERN